jgi:hypothetical protein
MKPDLKYKFETFVQLQKHYRPAIVLVQELNLKTLAKALRRGLGYDGGEGLGDKADTAVFFDLRVLECVEQEGGHKAIDLEADRKPVGRPATRLSPMTMPPKEFQGRYTAMRLRLKYGDDDSSNEFLAVSFHGYNNNVNGEEKARSIARFKNLVRKYCQEHGIPAITGGDFNVRGDSLIDEDDSFAIDRHPKDQSNEFLLQGQLEVPADDKRIPPIDYFYVSRPKTSDFVFRTSNRRGLGYERTKHDHQPILMSVDIIE